MDWDELSRGNGCPFDPPRIEPNGYWDTVAQLKVSTLCLAKNQAYKGQCILLYDRKHVTRPDHLTLIEWSDFADDAHQAAVAVASVCEPDHLNVECLGNGIPHLHWHIVPRYKTDPRWGAPIWTTTREEAHEEHLSDSARAALIADLRAALG